MLANVLQMQFRMYLDVRKILIVSRGIRAHRKRRNYRIWQRNDEQQ